MSEDSKKRCTKCCESKTLSEFPTFMRNKDGKGPWCKKCVAEAIRIWRHANPAKVKESNRRWNSSHPEKRKEVNLRWRAENDEKAVEAKRIRQKRWREKHIEEVRDSVNARGRTYRATPKGALNSRMTSSIRRAIQEKKAGNKWESLVGYSVNELIKHLSGKFHHGMGWHNMGQWHIDHKIPQAVFNYEKPEDIDFKRAWALDNLQPMWAIDNQKKSSKIKEPFQPSLAMTG